jgi:pyridoxal 5'-phosphate synthase pdxS subunit
VEAVTHYNDPDILAKVSRNLGEAMVGINVSGMAAGDKIAQRGW